MDIGVLGPLRVAGAHGPIEVRRSMERALLSLLAAHPGECVPTDVLVHGLWGSIPPATATKTLQTYVYRLRSQLPNGLIATDRTGYRLQVEPGEVDAWRFAETVTRVLDDGGLTPAERADRLASAVREWRGMPFADVDAAAHLGPVRARLEDLRLHAVAAGLEARVQAGRHREAMPELRGLLEEHPLREDLWATYALALYRSGRQGDALRALASARRTLAEELGVQPGPELQRLQEQVLDQDPALSAVEAGAGEPNGPDAATRVAAASAGGPSEPEQRLATFLVAEVIGSSTLRDAAGAEVARRVAAEVTDGLVASVRGLRGDVLSAEPWSLVAAFGATVARDDDASRAVLAGLRLEEALAGVRHQVARSWPGVELRVRTAVRTSLVNVPVQTGDLDDLTPDLECAEPGTVLVPRRTRALIEDLFEWGDEVVSDGQMGWPALAVARRPDKARLGRHLDAPLVGRETELATAAAAVESLRQGIGGVLMVSGEAGVGKSRLVRELGRAQGTDLRWLIGHCASYRESDPYTPFRDLLRSWLGLGHDPPDLKARIALQKALEATFDDPSQLYPYLGGVLGVTLEPAQARRLRLAPEALQYRTFEAVAALLAELSRERPLVVVIEDVHWSDHTSVRLLEALLALTASSALLLVLTARPDPDHPSARLGETARRALPHLTREIELPALDPTRQQTLLDELVGAHVLPLDMASRVLELAEGNPFHLEELVGSLVDAGALVGGPAGWRFDHDVAVTVPETVEKVVQARIDRLDRPAHDLVTAASVLGRSFGLPLLHGVTGEIGGVVESVDTLLRLGLLVQTQRWPEAAYVFKHALTQEAAYRLLPQERRRRLHKLAAGWLEEHYRDNPDEVAALLAHHWAAAGEDAAAVTWLLRAGSLARREHALDEAIEHYQRLLPILERREDRTTMALVLFRLALSLHNALRFAEANGAYQRAFQVWEPPADQPATATLRFAGLPFYRVPDPVRSFMPHDILLQMVMFDRLVERWPDDTIVPSLADRWEISADGLRYTFRLREGLVWSDGHPLTAGDVAFGLKRNLDPDAPGMSVSLLFVFEGAQDFAHRRVTDHRKIGVRALDDRTVEFRLVAPAPYLMGMLNRPDCGPQPQHHIERHGESWGAIEHEVVSGAFHRVSETPGHVELERRADYQGHRAGNVGRVDLRLASPSENRERFAAGDADLAWSDREPVTAPHAADPDEPPPGLSFLAFDHAEPLVADHRLRLALAHGIDRTVLASLLPEPDVAATGGLVPPALAGHTPDIAPRFDADLARRLVDANPPERPLVLAVRSSSSQDVVIGEALSRMWREHVGLTVEVDPRDPASFRALVDDGMREVDLVLASWFPGYADPEYFLRLLLHSEASDNDGGFADADFDDLIERARRERDGRTRLDLFHQADRLAVAEVAAVIPISYFSIPWLVRPGVRGWWQFGKSWANFADLTLDRPQSPPPPYRSADPSRVRSARLRPA